MLTLILLVILLWIVVTVVLVAWSLWFQAYIYSQPTPGLEWRGAAAGSAITFVLLVWIILDYRSPGSCRTLFESTSSETSKPYPEFRVPKPGGGFDVYRLRLGTRLDYRLDGKPTGKPLPTRPPEIVAVTGEDESVFKPERDDKGHFKTRSTSSTWAGSGSSEPLRYIDGKGRIMLETSLGEISTFHSGWVIGILLLNFIYLGVWFVSLWLLLRFQWPHALGQAIVFWGVMILFVLPPVLTRAENVAKERAAARAQAQE